MSPSKSVARSVRISSGAKSVPEVPEEYDLDCLQNTLHCQLDLFGRLSLSGTIYFTIDFNILLPNKNIPKTICYLSDEDYWCGSDIKISVSHILFHYNIFERYRLSVIISPFLFSLNLHHLCFVSVLGQKAQSTPNTWYEHCQDHWNVVNIVFMVLYRASSHCNILNRYFESIYIICCQMSETYDF